MLGQRFAFFSWFATLSWHRRMSSSWRLAGFTAPSRIYARLEGGKCLSLSWQAHEPRHRSLKLHGVLFVRGEIIWGRENTGNLLEIRGSLLYRRQAKNWVVRAGGQALMRDMLLVKSYVVEADSRSSDQVSITEPLRVVVGCKGELRW